VKELLSIVALALKNTTIHERSRSAREAQSSADAERRIEEEKQRCGRMMRTTWHDGRLDCVAGNGVMSELGGGDELMRADDFDMFSADVGVGGVPSKGIQSFEKSEIGAEYGDNKPKIPLQDVEALETVPIVIIKNYSTKRGKDEVLSVLANWAASLVENQVSMLVHYEDSCSLIEAGCTCHCR
jgi:hypothetical protein